MLGHFSPLDVGLRDEEPIEDYSVHPHYFLSSTSTVLFRKATLLVALDSTAMRRCAPRLSFPTSLLGVHNALGSSPGVEINPSVCHFGN